MGTKLDVNTYKASQDGIINAIGIYINDIKNTETSFGGIFYNNSENKNINLKLESVTTTGVV